MTDDLLSANEAARRLGITTATLYDWLAQSDVGTLIIRGQPVTINYFQGGTKGQGRIKLEVGEIKPPQRSNASASSAGVSPDNTYQTKMLPGDFGQTGPPAELTDSRGVRRSLRARAREDMRADRRHAWRPRRVHVLHLANRMVAHDVRAGKPRAR